MRSFNPTTMRMELSSFSQLIFSHDAQAKFVHTSIAGYVTGAIFVAGVSAWYLLKNRHVELARRSFRMAVLFGVLSTAGVITLGDALGFVGGQAQPTKLAAMEGLWKSEAAPMPFNLVAFPAEGTDQPRPGAGAVCAVAAGDPFAGWHGAGLRQARKAGGRTHPQRHPGGRGPADAVEQAGRCRRAGPVPRARKGSRLRLPGAALLGRREQGHGRADQQGRAATPSRRWRRSSGRSG